MKNGKSMTRGQSQKRFISSSKGSVKNLDNTQMARSKLRKPPSLLQLKTKQTEELFSDLVVDQESHASSIQQDLLTKVQLPKTRPDEEFYHSYSSLPIVRQSNSPLTMSQSIIRQIESAMNKTPSAPIFNSGNSEEKIPNVLPKPLKQTRIKSAEIFSMKDLGEEARRKGTNQKKISWQRQDTPPSDRWVKDSSASVLPYQEFEYFQSWTHFANQQLIDHIQFQHHPQHMKLFQGDQMLYFIKLYKDAFTQNYNALQYCKRFRQPPYSLVKPKAVNLPEFDETKYRGTIVFDMDETLIHCNERPEMIADHNLQVKFPNGECIDIRISVRPFIRECLEILSKQFELIVFTASQEAYANKVLDAIDPKNEYLGLRFYRDSCFLAEDGLLVKDLRIFANRDLKKLVLVDNAAYSYSMQIGNGVPILPYFDNKADRELLWLTHYLTNLQGDFTKINRKSFKLHLYQEGMSMDETLIMLFQGI